jgi:hypothetical protein
MSLMFMTTAGMMVGESGSEALVVVVARQPHGTT